MSTPNTDTAPHLVSYTKDTDCRQLKLTEIIPLLRNRLFNIPPWGYEVAEKIAKAFLNGNPSVMLPDGTGTDALEAKTAVIAAFLSTGYIESEPADVRHQIEMRGNITSRESERLGGGGYCKYCGHFHTSIAAHMSSECLDNPHSTASRYATISKGC